MRRARRIITVGGGQGGVGTSVVASNLAVAMAQVGAEVVLVDADLGAAHQHTLFGLDQPGPTVQSFLDHEVDSLDAARASTTLSRLSLIRGASAVVGAANPTWGEKQRLLRHVEQLDADVVLVDVGAGTAFNQLDVFSVGDLRVLVVAPQRTALESAYAFMKGVVYQGLGRLLAARAFEGVLEKPHAGTARVSHLLGEAMACSPRLAAEVHAFLRASRVSLFGNLLNEPREVAVLSALVRTMKDFLSVDCAVLGHAPASAAVQAAVHRGRPVTLDAPSDPAAVAFRRAALALLDASVSRHQARHAA